MPAGPPWLTIGGRHGGRPICNLYTNLRAQTAISQLARALRDKTGNLKRMAGVFPDYSAPIVRTGEDGVRELVMARWGMPTPAFALEGKSVDKGVTNVRNTKSPHWRRWLAPAARCLVPFTSFAEPNRLADGTSENVWFALGEDRPLAFFAGVWTNWTSVRKKAEGEVNADLFAFLTTEPNAEVAGVHQKAMPVILTNEDEREMWLNAPWELAQALQRPLPDGALQVVAHGVRLLDDVELPADA